MANEQLKYRKLGYDQAIDDVIYIIRYQLDTQSFEVNKFIKQIEGIKWANE